MDETLQRPAPVHLRHTALVYNSAEGYLATAVGFLQEGLEAGQAAVVAHTRAGLALVRDALGADASRVTFVDISAAYTRPARALAAYHDVYAEQLRTASSVRSVADVQAGADPRDRDTWTTYDAALNRSFAHLPAWVLCSYDARALPGATVEAVWRTHPEVVTGGRWSTSSRWEDPAELLREATPKPARLKDLRPMSVRRDARDFRENLARELAAERVPESKAFDLIVAAAEVMDNAQQHGGGLAAVRTGRVDGRFVCEVVDHGPGFDDPLAGYLAPAPGSAPACGSSGSSRGASTSCTPPRGSRPASRSEQQRSSAPTPSRGGSGRSRSLG